MRPQSAMIAPTEIAARLEAMLGPRMNAPVLPAILVMPRKSTVVVMPCAVRAVLVASMVEM